MVVYRILPEDTEEPAINPANWSKPLYEYTIDLIYFNRLPRVGLDESFMRQLIAQQPPPPAPEPLE